MSDGNAQVGKGDAGVGNGGGAAMPMSEIAMLTLGRSGKYDAGIRA